MKKTVYITAAVVAFFLLLYGLANLALPDATPPPVATEVQAQPPAPYPADFDAQLARMSSLKIQRHEESAKDIPWQTTSEFPEIGSPLARKGGTIRQSNVGPFPANFLAFGSPTPQFFHYNLFDKIDVPLIREHPDTGEIIPGLAEAWAEHQGMLWFRLNPSARYSNGRPVRAGDFALGACLREQAGDTVLGSVVVELHTYGDNVLAVKLRKEGFQPLLKATMVLHPAEPSFYAEFGPDYKKRYQDRVPPTTGAYTVGKVQRGRLITLVRNKSWWAKDLPGFRYTCNADSIEHHFLTDEAQVWELFLKGKLDVLQTRNIVAWQDKLTDADTRIVQRRFTLHYPMPPYGIALNAQTLPDINLRRGLMHAMDMQHAINIIFRGDVERLQQFGSGYRSIPTIRTLYQYNPESARAYFHAAGYTECGADGILARKDGTRLSIRLAYTPSDKISTLVALLVQSAADCGAEIVPEPLPWQNCSELVHQKQHQMIFWATVAGAYEPEYRRSFHSSATGDDAPFGLNSKELDAAIEFFETAATPADIADRATDIELLIYEHAVWLPGWMENRVNIATWPHVHFPQATYSTYDLTDSHIFWLSN